MTVSLCPRCGTPLNAADGPVLGVCPQCSVGLPASEFATDVALPADAPTPDATRTQAYAGPPAAAAAEWAVGDVILGLYEVRHVHTAGGMGLVYRVRHRGWHTDLALKRPRAEPLRDDAG